MNGIAEYGERVVVVKVHSGQVNLTTGHISSTEASHVEADNLHKTIVRGDRKTRAATKEANEKAYKVDDIHLLKEQEAKSLGSLEAVQDWFGSIYEDHVVARIQRALKRLGIK